MTNLYDNLAEIYDAMYQTFIDYEEEYAYYGNILKKENKNNVLEIGSGSGNLAPLFVNNGFTYTGLDQSSRMIDLASAKNPNSLFIQSDMQDFELPSIVDSCIITGRTISYLLTNKAINSTFSTIHKNLEESGILSFDFIDANRFIPTIDPNKTIVHEATYNNVNYRRESIWSLNLKNGMDFKWIANYFKKEDGQFKLIVKDKDSIRTFTKNEIEIFLQINGFTVLEFINKASYAFPTFVVVAQKTSKQKQTL